MIDVTLILRGPYPGQTTEVIAFASVPSVGHRIAMRDGSEYDVTDVYWRQMPDRAGMTPAVEARKV